MLKNTALTFSISKSINIIILLAFILTPIFSIQESLALIFGGIINNSTALSPVYIKGLKDLAFILIVLFGILGVLNKGKMNKISLFMFTYLFLILATAFFLKENLTIYFVGIRWLMPLILIVFLIPYITKELLEKVSIILGYLFLLHFVMQLFQLFFAEGWFGLNALGLSNRNPGIFFIPSTSAFFTILVLFFAMFYLPHIKLRNLIFVLSPLSIFLTASGAGVVVYIVIISIYILKNKFFKLIPLLIGILFLFIISTIEYITGRPGLIEESFGTRIKIFFDILETANMFSQNLGLGTNTGYLINNNYGLEFNMQVTDSAYASIIVNLGLINFIIIFILLFGFLFINWLNKDKEKLIFIFIFGLFSAITIIFEAYPMNLIFAILIAYYLRNYKKEKERTYETPNNPQ